MTDVRENPPSAAAHDPYRDYARWKGWQGAFETSVREARYFAAEFKDIGLRDLRVLEIGFGNGSFMAWARGQGAHVAGLEINEQMLAAAVQHGYAARTASLGELAAQGEQFDLIVAFDVIEHWDTQELIDNFRDAARLLAHGGRLLVRFPNGHSPFGRVYQYGDFTHKSVISAYKIEYLAGLSDLDVVRIANVCRVSARAGTLRALRQRWLALRRAWIERSLSKLYGTPRLPLAPNLVAVLARRAAREG